MDFSFQLWPPTDMRLTPSIQARMSNGRRPCILGGGGFATTPGGLLSGLSRALLTSLTELTVQGSRFLRSGRLKRSETVGRRPSMPETVISMLIQPQKSTKTRLKGRRLPPFQHSCHPLGHPRAQLLRGCRSQHVPASQLVPDHTKHASPTTHAQSPQTQAVLQTAVGRLDPRPHRVPFLEDIGFLFPTPRGQTALL